MEDRLVLVTGGSGFVGSYCIAALLRAGYRVRTTLRNLGREPDVRAMLSKAGATNADGLSFAAADLMSDDGWDAAVAGCEYVLHVASPFPQGSPEDEDALIVPARDGTLRVLRAAREAGVKRVVVTSSFAAVGYGSRHKRDPFTESDWTDASNRRLSAYVRSKTLAECAAWDFVEQHGDAPELTVVNPVGVFGPVLGADYSSSIHMLQAILDGTMRGYPQVWFGIVDVRDLAELQVRAMTHPQAAGERFLAVAGECVTMKEIAEILKERLGSLSQGISTRQLPNWQVRIAALFSRSAASVVAELGVTKRISNSRARTVLGWTPRSNEETIVDTATSLQQLKTAGVTG